MINNFGHFDGGSVGAGFEAGLTDKIIPSCSFVLDNENVSDKGGVFVTSGEASEGAVNLTVGLGIGVEVNLSTAEVIGYNVATVGGGADFAEGKIFIDIAGILEGVFNFFTGNDKKTDISELESG